MKLKTHKHTYIHPHPCTHPVRSCTWHDSIRTRKDPKGIGSNEDSGLEQGYRNKLSSVCVFGYTQPPNSPYQLKRSFKAVRIPLAGPQSAGEEKMAKGKRRMKWARSRDVYTALSSQGSEVPSTFCSRQRLLAESYMHTPNCWLNYDTQTSKLWVFLSLTADWNDTKQSPVLDWNGAGCSFIWENMYSIHFSRCPLSWFDYLLFLCRIHTNIGEQTKQECEFLVDDLQFQRFGTSKEPKLKPFSHFTLCKLSSLLHHSLIGAVNWFFNGFSWT